eukprot:Pompholyxophrys_punicea_v1_NODE_944_length_1112_cov_2.399243.p2 type:complete len:143 gc:universal NODE_944_length_1112_cov_2.399243:979-551(-)
MRSLPEEEVKLLQRAISSSLLQLNFDFPLKEKQYEALVQFWSGEHTLAILPCGYGKTLIFLLIPLIFDFMFPNNERSFILIVSPLRMLMKAHVRSLEKTNLQAVYFGERVTESHFQQMIEKLSEGFLLHQKHSFIQNCGAAC